MKKILFLFAMLLVSTGIQAQTIVKPSFVNPEWGAIHGTATAVDVDGDGHCDIVMAGESNYNTNPPGTSNPERNRMNHVLLYNPTAKTWTSVGATGLTFPTPAIAFNATIRPSITPCDMNQDGIMDIVVFETPGMEKIEQPVMDHISTEGIFLGYGDGTFSKTATTFINPDGTDSDFDMAWIASGDVADFNNDGLLDIVGVGYHKNANRVRLYDEANVVLLNQGGGCFVVSHFTNDEYVLDYGQQQKTYHLSIAEVNAYDFNNDGYVDFFVCGQSNDASLLGVSEGTNTHFTDLFLNDPEHPGQFRRQYICDSRWDSPLTAISEGGVAIADYNNDGTPDLFISGWSGKDRGSYVWGLYTSTLLRDGSVVFNAEGNDGLDEMRNQTSTNTQYAAFDWDADGNYDIANLGWSPELQTQTAFISTGNGEGKFKSTYRMPGNSEGFVFFNDCNNDGRIDYVTSGQTGDGTIYDTSDFRKVFVVVNNEFDAPAAPEAPVLSEAFVDGSKVTLTWNDAPSVKQNVTYEYYVKDSEGNIVAGGNSFTEGTNNGKRKVMRPGNAYNARCAKLSLPAGSYTYGVQTVDACFTGSAFATGAFTITDDAQPAMTAEIERVEQPLVNSEGNSYTNPVINVNAPDPTIVRDDRKLFYLFSTETGGQVPIYRSKDLVSWTRVGAAFNSTTRPNFVDGNIWAPDAKKVGDKYHLYFSMSKWGGEWEAGIGVATATKASGPYSNAHKLFISSEIGVQNSIDPFFIEDNGTKYLFWGSFRGIYYVELSDDGLSLKDGAKAVQVAGTLTEGTFIKKHGDYYYLIGSAGTCCEGENSTYHLMVARSTSVTGPYVDKFGKPALSNNFSGLLYRTKDVIGPGHNGDIFTDDEGQDWIVYHGFDAANTGAGRKVYLDKLCWDEDGWPYINNMRPSNQSPAPVFKEATGIDDIFDADAGDDSNVKIFPTYVKRSLQINHAAGETFQWQVVNLNGELVAKGSGEGQTTVDFYAQPTGMYIVSVTSRTGKRSQKVIRY